MRRLRALLPAAGLLLAGGAAAAEDAGFQALSGGKLLETLLGLVLVLALIFVLTRVLRRMQGGFGGNSQLLSVISSLSLGARERVLLLKVADKHILVAATAQNITPLHVFDELPEELLETREQANGFAQLMQSLNGSAER